MLRNLFDFGPIIKLSTNIVGSYQTSAAKSCKSYLQLSPILSFSSSSSLSSNHAKRYVTTLTAEQINSILRRDEVSFESLNSKANNNQYLLPSYVKSLECNQLSSNCPIEDRIRISTVNIPDSPEPALILGVFDGHGGRTTAELISRRLFNYISLALHPERVDLNDLHHCPEPKHDPASLQPDELDCLAEFKREISQNNGDIVANLCASFTQCDQDLSKEIQKNLITQANQSQATLHYYLSAAVSGCCALVMVIHRGISYLASVGDCRAVLGQYSDVNANGTPDLANNNNRAMASNFTVTELLEEHNCDNVNEVKRLTNSHPLSEQNTLIKQNRLLGHLMPFRAFGDFQYKWPADVIKAAGLTKAFGSGLLPMHYQTPPYLIAEPDIRVIDLISSFEAKHDDGKQARCLVMATDGLWELFESSHDVIETLTEHSATKKLLESGNQGDFVDEDFDENSATHLLRAALRSSSAQDIGMNVKELKRMHHVRLEAMLTLPKSISRNFRDDISILVLKLET